MFVTASLNAATAATKLDAHQVLNEWAMILLICD